MIVLDSLGIGALPDAHLYGDEGSNTLGGISGSDKLHIPTLRGLGLYNIDGVELGPKSPDPTACFARLAQKSAGKDTITGHWEIAGIISPDPMPTYPGGFPQDVITALESAWGRKIICNRPYSGTEVIADFGERHLATGDLIVYTSADSVLQIAAHEEIVPLPLLYEYCKTAREIMSGKHAVGRVIARPFVGEPGNFSRTANRHDYSLSPPGPTVLDSLLQKGLDVIGIGKIGDIFVGRGIAQSFPSKSNADGMRLLEHFAAQDFSGLCFANLVDFDMLFGHRNDIDGYAAALSQFDAWLASFIPKLGREDMLILTADHGCDPSFKGTDHTREYVPLIACGQGLRTGINLGTRESFADIAATLLDVFEVGAEISGQSFWQDCKLQWLDRRLRWFLDDRIY